MATLRSPEMAEQYHQHLVGAVDATHCPLCHSEPIKMFEHWKIIPNNYPYDLIASKHDMLVTLRHVQEGQFTPEETAELFSIKHTYLPPSEYDCILEPTERNKSIPTHCHFHLLVLKV